MTMYKFLPRWLAAAQKSSVGFCETNLFLIKDTKIVSPALKFASKCGGRPLSTTSGRFSGEKNDVASFDQEEKKNADERPGSTEASEEKTSASQVSTDQDVESGNSGTVDVRATQQEEAVKVEQPKQVKPKVAKSGKESLLELLGSMNVEVTNKRKLPNARFKQSNKPVSSSKPAMESTINMFQQATVEASSQRKTLDPELVAAASAAASTFQNRSKAESELLMKLRQHESVTEAQKSNNLDVIIAAMKVGKVTNRQQSGRATSAIRFDDDVEGYAQESGGAPDSDGVRRRRSLFKGKRLNIFTATPDEEKVESAVARPTLWDIHFANQLSSVTNQMPRNGFEEMIQWTKEGKMWRYPIDNEDGLEEEASVSFHEHVFLDKHLEEGFPRQGPIRHFMELVVAGLSKNPYLTVKQKKDHIFWFRDYFHEKEAVLNEAEVYLK